MSLTDKPRGKVIDATCGRRDRRGNNRYSGGGGRMTCSTAGRTQRGNDAQLNAAAAAATDVL